ncbi:phage minor head protein [Dyella sp. 20L07]|uniref:phage minor head protein n=1 Tax=Dyella sp. 20L07 TaxID=3384240 RepID=UPI003D2D1E9A
MDIEERLKRFAAEEATQRAVLPRVQKDVLEEIVRQLGIAQASVIAELQAKSSESAQRRLRALRAEIERNLEDFRQVITASALTGDDRAWSVGQATIVEPFASAGVSLSGLRIDSKALMASRRFLTDRIQDISTRALNKLNGSLIQHVIGGQSLSDTITDVQNILGGAPRSRAMTLTYTEIGRVHSVAQDERLQQAGQIVPGLRKRWLKSGKRQPRLDHVHAHNQIVAFDQPYVVGGEQLQYPRDPSGSAGNTINCGCLSQPVVDGSSFGASTVQIDDDGSALIIGPRGGIVRRLS